MNKILLSGAAGRMGHEIAANAESMGFTVAFGVDANTDFHAAFPVYPSFSACQGEADVLIDFSRPALLPDLLTYALQHRLPCVLAATGYTETDQCRIAEAAKQIPVFQSSNLSVGVYVLNKLAQQAKALLPGFDIEIIEKHHRGKADAPSGTALTLLKTLSDADTVPLFGRNGASCKRLENEITVHAVRGGTLAGEHEIDFLGEYETLTITHSAQSRTIFALGALRAAKFLLNQPAGLYDMYDLMGV